MMTEAKRKGRPPDDYKRKPGEAWAPKVERKRRKTGPYKPKPNRKPTDAMEFVADIHRAIRELDFALTMYGVEMEVQGFTEAEIKREIQRVFIENAFSIINE